MPDFASVLHLDELHVTSRNPQVLAPLIHSIKPSDLGSIGGLRHGGGSPLLAECPVPDPLLAGLVENVVIGSRNLLNPRVQVQQSVMTPN